MLEGRYSRVAPGTWKSEEVRVLYDLRDTVRTCFDASKIPSPLTRDSPSAKLLHGNNLATVRKVIEERQQSSPLSYRQFCDVSCSQLGSRYACLAQASPRVDVAEAPSREICSRRVFQVEMRPVSSAGISFSFFEKYPCAEK